MHLASRENPCSHRCIAHLTIKLFFHFIVVYFRISSQAGLNTHLSDRFFECQKSLLSLCIHMSYGHIVGIHCIAPRSVLVYIQMCQQSRRIGGVILHCNLQCGITQPILLLFWHASTCTNYRMRNYLLHSWNGGLFHGKHMFRFYNQRRMNGSKKSCKLI